MCVAWRCPYLTDFLYDWPKLLGNYFLQTVQLLTVHVRIKSLEGEQLIVGDSIPSNAFPSTLACSKFAPFHHNSTMTVWIRVVVIDSLHYQKPFASEMKQLRCVLAAWFKDGNLGHKGFFTLTHVTLIHGASFCIQPHFNCSKRLFVQCLAPRESKQGLHNGWTGRFSLFARYFRQLAHNFFDPQYILKRLNKCAPYVSAWN